MANIRTTIKLALFNRLKEAVFDTPIAGASTWVESSQRLKLWGNVDKSQQPALFLVQHHEQYENRGAGLLPRRFLNVGAWCYAPSGDEDIIGDVLLDIMEAAIENVLGVDDRVRNECTLGGVLEPNGWVHIDRAEGLFIRDPGDIDGQAMLVLPLKILLP